MVMIVQINFDEIPSLDHFPNEGILQLYLSSEAWNEDEFTIVYIKPK